MGRSVKKGPYIDPKLQKKVQKVKADGDTNKVIRTYARSSVIFPDMVGLKFEVHNGKEFKFVLVSEDMVGHKLGEFSPTRTWRGHASKGKVSKVYGSTGRVFQDEE